MHPDTHSPVTRTTDSTLTAIIDDQNSIIDEQAAALEQDTLLLAVSVVANVAQAAIILYFILA